MWLLFTIFAVVVIVGNAMILWRTAKMPKLPGSVRPKPKSYEDDDHSSW